MKIGPWLQLIRWQNLIMLLLVHLLLRFSLFPKYSILPFLSTSKFFLLSLSCMLIMAGGYVINDIFDVRTDTINKPEKVIINKSISVSLAKIAYAILSLAGLAIGLYLSFFVGKTINFLWHPLTVLLLVIYSKYLKYSFLSGNILIGLLLFISIIIIAFFDLIPGINPGTSSNSLVVFKYVLSFGTFAFLLTLLREVSKDAEDVEGDRLTGSDTLPVRFGFKITNKVLMITGITTCILIFIFSLKNYTLHTFLFLYLLIAAIMPLLYFVYLVKSNSTKTDYKKSSLFLKVIMLTGMLGILFV
ncbi:MAG: geranylgeranylglycerol-phosphate geranylgeranyltransferase [Flavobacteriaceae bacterium]|nr:geranylgeranylglycerol-phosphate geranylgeranyltransferase [Flavobacteriaceae bacterium]